MKPAETRIHVYLPRDLARRLKAALALEGRSVSAWFREVAEGKVKGGRKK